MFVYTVKGLLSYYCFITNTVKKNENGFFPLVLDTSHIGSYWGEDDNKFLQHSIQKLFFFKP